MNRSERGGGAGGRAKGFCPANCQSSGRKMSRSFSTALPLFSSAAHSLYHRIPRRLTQHNTTALRVCTFSTLRLDRHGVAWHGVSTQQSSVLLLPFPRSLARFVRISRRLNPSEQASRRVAKEIARETMTEAAAVTTLSLSLSFLSPALPQPASLCCAAFLPPSRHRTNEVMMELVACPVSFLSVLFLSLSLNAASSSSFHALRQVFHPN